MNCSKFWYFYLSVKISHVNLRPFLNDGCQESLVGELDIICPKQIPGHNICVVASLHQCEGHTDSSIDWKELSP